jgi:hypothetical protein
MYGILLQNKFYKDEKEYLVRMRWLLSQISKDTTIKDGVVGLEWKDLFNDVAGLVHSGMKWLEQIKLESELSENNRSAMNIPSSLFLWHTQRYLEEILKPLVRVICKRKRYTVLCIKFLSTWCMDLNFSSSRDSDSLVPASRKRLGYMGIDMILKLPIERRSSYEVLMERIYKRTESEISPSALWYQEKIATTFGIWHALEQYCENVCGNLGLEPSILIHYASRSWEDGNTISMINVQMLIKTRKKRKESLVQLNGKLLLFVDGWLLMSSPMNTTKAAKGIDPNRLVLYGSVSKVTFRQISVIDNIHSVTESFDYDVVFEEIQKNIQIRMDIHSHYRLYNLLKTRFITPISIDHVTENLEPYLSRQFEIPVNLFVPTYKDCPSGVEHNWTNWGGWNIRINRYRSNGTMAGELELSRANTPTILNRTLSKSLTNVEIIRSCKDSLDFVLIFKQDSAPLSTLRSIDRIMIQIPFLSLESNHAYDFLVYILSVTTLVYTTRDSRDHNRCIDIPSMLTHLPEERLSRNCSLVDNAEMNYLMRRPSTFKVSVDNNDEYEVHNSHQEQDLLNENDSYNNTETKSEFVNSVDSMNLIFHILAQYEMSRDIRECIAFG